MRQPKPFLLRPPFGPRPWSIRQGRRWRFAEDIVVQVTVVTSQQEGEWFLAGVGVVKCLARGKIVVTA